VLAVVTVPALVLWARRLEDGAFFIFFSPDSLPVEVRAGFFFSVLLAATERELVFLTAVGARLVEPVVFCSLRRVAVSAEATVSALRVVAPWRIGFSLGAVVVKRILILSVSTVARLLLLVVVVANNLDIPDVAAAMAVEVWVLPDMLLGGLVGSH